MYRFALLYVGKQKKLGWTDLQRHYHKLIRPYGHLELIRLEAKSHSARHKQLDEEKQLFEKHWKPNFINLALSEEGLTMDSTEFAGFLQKQANQGNPRIAFVIGGPFGLHEQIKNKCHLVFSLSRLTFAHSLAQILLLEQLYRAMAILHNKTYHY